MYKDKIEAMDCRKCGATKGGACFNPYRQLLYTTVHEDDKETVFCYERVYDYLETFRAPVRTTVDTSKIGSAKREIVMVASADIDRLLFDILNSIDSSEAWDRTRRDPSALRAVVKQWLRATIAYGT